MCACLYEYLFIKKFCQHIILRLLIVQRKTKFVITKYVMFEKILCRKMYQYLQRFVIIIKAVYQHYVIFNIFISNHILHLHVSMLIKLIEIQSTLF